MTIHDDIDNYLAADLHGDLSEEERNAFHTHLVECADCRQFHQETKAMNKVLEEKLEAEKPDLAFENRILAGFRDRVPARAGSLGRFPFNLVHSRATQLAGVAALLLALVQVGRMITGEHLVAGRSESQPLPLEQSVASTIGQNREADLAKSAALRTRKNSYGYGPLKTAQDSGVAAPPPPATATGGLGQAGLVPEFHEEKAAPTQEKAKRSSDDESVVQSAPAGAPEAENPVDTYRRDDSEPAGNANPALANRKLIRNATVDLEIVSFDQAVQKITAFASEEKGYVATTSSEKQQNGKLKGEIVVKVLPENLDRFLQKIRGLGELKNQTLGTEDITKNYFDTEARLKNARVMEQR